MRMVISDVVNLPAQMDSKIIVPDSSDVIHPCIGCFGCWIKTPGQCVIKDTYSNMGELLGQSEELILISSCTYGGFSPFVKNVLDRAISYISPHFVVRNKELHHKRRYSNVIHMQAHFYGDNITEKEKSTAVNLVSANAVNYDAMVKGVYFYSSIDKVKEAFQ